MRFKLILSLPFMVLIHATCILALSFSSPINLELLGNLFGKLIVELMKQFHLFCNRFRMIRDVVCDGCMSRLRLREFEFSTERIMDIYLLVVCAAAPRRRRRMFQSRRRLGVNQPAPRQYAKFHADSYFFLSIIEIDWIQHRAWTKACILTKNA